MVSTMKIGVLGRPYGAQRKLDEVGHAGTHTGTVTVELCTLNFKVSNIRQF
jgi:hypothetical protein